ncbi:hypothetical protein GOA94_17990 [Sinorhizobium meliloti]|nr:hypothetical protein [Sinorhizobium meliloti]
MADPTKYTPAYSYSGWQASNPSRPLPADEVDNDFANVSLSVNQAIDAIKDVRRSDGKLKNQSVGPDQLSPALTIGFTFTGTWVDGRSYSAGDGVVSDDTFYSARVAHTADVSNAPGNGAYWNALFSLNDIVVTGGMSLPRDSFVGDGVTKDFTLSFVPLSKFNLFVQVGGVVQGTDAYSSNGNTLTFINPPPNGYGIEVRGFATVSTLVVPEDGSVSTEKLADLAVTEGKLAVAVTLKLNGAMQKATYDPQNIEADAFDPANHVAAVWSSGRTENMKNRSRYQCHIVDFCSPSDVNENTAAITEWARQGQEARAKLVLGADGMQTAHADFITQEEIEITRPGQVIEWANAGGYAYGEDVGEHWSLAANRNTRLRVVGGLGGWFNTTGKRVRSRRLFRGSAADPQDAPLSVALNIQAEGVQIIRPHIWLDCDYSDASPSNLGDFCDVGIFIGCRVGVQIHDAQIIGYFRRAGIYVDVSGHTQLNRMADKSGTPYPDGTVKNGADGTHLFNPYIRGPRQGLAILGALPKVGQTDYTDPYYDQQLGGTVADARGSFGCSDLLVIGGRIYGPEHHSNRRLKNPVGAPSSANLLAEPDDAPCAVKIDGLAGNSSGKIWGMRFVGTRIATFEALRLWTVNASRVTLFSCHVEGRGGGRMDTAGNVIDPNDTTNHSYGDWAATASTIWGNVRDSVRTSRASFAPHFYGTSLDWEGADGSNDHVRIGDDDARPQDYRSGTEHRHRIGNVSKHLVDASGTRAFDAFYTGSITVADDAVGNFTPAFVGGQLMITNMGNGGGFPAVAHSGTIGFDVGGTPAISKYGGGANLAALGTTIPTGTSGVDGNTSVSCVSDGKIYIENRSGGPVTYFYTIVR